MTVFDDRACMLGEGPLWHPERQQLFWFDILGKRLLTQQSGEAKEWQFDEHVSAAGWVDHDTLLMASETSLSRFDITTGTREVVVSLEADDKVTRSNDGRADPWGGFWIGTMGKNAEPNAGAIYRYYRGELHCLYSGISITNAICFAPDRACAYYTDTATGQVMRQKLNADDGNPLGDPSVFVDFRNEGLNPDGAVVDADGTVWIAQWGASRVAGYDPKGACVGVVPFPAEQTSCPAFGGPDLSTMYCTSACVGLSGRVKAAEPRNGMTFAVPTEFRGQPEHRVIL